MVTIKSTPFSISNVKRKMIAEMSSIPEFHDGLPAQFRIESVRTGRIEEFMLAERSIIGNDEDNIIWEFRNYTNPDLRGWVVSIFND